MDLMYCESNDHVAYDVTKSRDPKIFEALYLHNCAE